MTNEQDEALSIARSLASAGIPIFIANPAENKTGYVPPSGWQNTVADPSVVDLWRPGLALCAVMGSGLDLIDIDPRNGGTLNDEIDAVTGYGLVATPSGGVHKFIKSLEAGSRDNLFPGVDIKGGRVDGTGRGFVFLAPTVRASAVDGVERAYRWIQGPSSWDVEDSSGSALAQKISSLVGVRSVAVDSPDWWQEFVSNSGPQSIPAAQKAVANKITSIVEFTGTDGEGFRTVLMRAAITIGGYVAAGVIEESEAQTRLEEAVSSVWGAPDQDDLLWIQQGLTDGHAKPFNVYSAADLLAMGFSDAEITDEELWTFYNAIGDTEFRVSGGTDQEYADCVLDRIYPGMRFAVDAGTWLIRKKELWSERPEGASSAVSALARLMPLGDGDLPTRKADYTAEHWVAVRRAKFMNSGTAASIERKMRSVVQIPGHGGGLDLSALDVDPHILWAGGVAWDLKASSVVPTPAGWVPLDTPHMHSALVAPDAGVATPLWDAFVAAVWPDPAIRAWALRVLSVAITGYPDAALPILYGRERSGKALDIDTPMLTTNGWSTMGELQAGDQVYGVDGYPVEVASVSRVMHERRCYRVTTSDGRSLIADSEHLWTVCDQYGKQRTLTTQEILDKGVVQRFQRGRPSYRYRLPRQPIVESKPVDLPLDPYLLGVWLGDGSSTKATAFFGDADVDELCGHLTDVGVDVGAVKRRTCWDVSLSTGRHGGLKRALRELNLLNNKHIPDSYLAAGTEQRLELLRGLLDTDGYIDAKRGRIEFCSTRNELAEGVLYLARSLGWKTTCTEGVASIDGRVIGPKWRVCFTPKTDEATPFKLARRVARITDRYTKRSQAGVVSIASIEPVDSRPVRCIRVDREDGLYLAGADLVPTHNTSLVEMLLDVLGTYGRPANAKLLGDNKDHDTIVYELKGARLAFIDEGPRKGYDATERLKQLTGGSKLTGRPMRANPIAFTPTHTLVMTTNNEPQLTDPALRARARLIPCNTDEVVVRPLRQALLDAAVLKAEAPGILARMMREAALWLADRNSATIGAAPDSIKGMALEIAEGQDPVREWVLDCTIPTDPGTPGRQLYSQFATWHQSSALYRRSAVPSETHFGRTLSDMGYPAVKFKSAWYRPLSNLGGPNYPHVVPSPTTYMAGSPANSGGLGVSGGLAAGSKHQPAGPETPRSGGVSTSVSGGLAGLLHTSLSQKETEGDRALSTNPTEETCDLTRQPANPPEIGPLPAETPSAGLSDIPPQTRRDPEKLTKAQIRAQEKEAARLEAVEEASGELHVLPAAVDRAGNVVDLTYDQAVTVVRSCLARTQGALTVDVETSGYPVGHRDYKLRSVQLGDEIASVVFDPFWNAKQIILLLEEATTLHAHSASADLVPLAVAGLIDIDSGWARMVDTVIPAKLGDPQSTGSDPGLKKLAMAVLGAEATAPGADADREKVFKAGKWLTRAKNDTPVERNGWSQIETGCKTMLRYAASDVLDTAALAKRLPPVPGNVLARERIAEEMTARVAYTGLQIDRERVHELMDHHTTLQAQAGDEVRQFGIDNPGSGPQVAEKLIELGAQLPVSDKGNASVAEHVLSILKRSDSDAGRLASAVLDYRKSSTALGLFLNPYWQICELADGRARPTIYTLGTDTGRMSCVRPNFQQLPREGGVRSVVVADPGFVFISADFSGVELRGAAALSQDQTMMHMIREEDEGRFDGFHWAVARQAFGPDATYAQRYIAKRGVFGHIYGGGVTTLAQQVGVLEEEMRAIVESLKVLTPGLAAWSNNVRQAVRQGHTQFPSYSGRIIHFPRDYPHKAPNYAIQGSCREVLVDALIKWRDTAWGKCTVLPIHDELMVMVPEYEAEEATNALVSCMESELYGVKIVAEPSEPSTYWQDAA